MTALSDSANNVIAVDDITITTGSCPQGASVRKSLFYIILLQYNMIIVL